MPSRFAGRILAHLTHDNYRPATPGEIERQMQISVDDAEIFEKAVALLLEDERVEIGTDEKIRLPGYGDETEGSIKINVKGFAFVRPDRPVKEGDLFIPRGETKDAISGDRVRCRVMRRNSSGSRDRGRGAGRSGGPGGDSVKRSVVGRVLEVLERGRTRFAGNLVRQGRHWFIEPDGKILQAPVLVRDPHAKNAKAGDKVVFDLVVHPDESTVGEAAITEVLGVSGEPDVETRAVIESYGLRDGFEDVVLDEARAAAATFEHDSKDIGDDREDLSDRLIFTIDPPDAKDFDDAISIDYDEESGEWELGVHIADVANFVETGSEIDLEAERRGNSAYLPRLVLPMIPETLSNGVCSLQEGVPRFTKSAFIHLDNKGRVMGTRLARTLIHSRKRLTYLEAQALIDGDVKLARQHTRAEPAYEDDLLLALRRADKLARIIRTRRMRDGMLVLGLPEFELVFDEEGHVIDAQPEDDAYTHTIIEMFMVEANEAVARTFSDLSLPLLRRVHPEPTFHDIEELREHARMVGFNLPEEPDRTDIKSLLDATRDSPASRAIHFAVLRTLTKATYSPAIIGHFALAGDHYAHFTSPIRRYPDLMVHRAIDAFLDHTENGRKVGGGKARARLRSTLEGDSRIADEARLLEIGLHCSDTEVAAEGAERELRSFLVIQFLAEKHLGDELPGVVTHIRPNGGLFVSLDRYLVDGMASLSELGSSSQRDDRWTQDRQSGRLVAARSGASLGLGDQVIVKILRADAAGRQLDLAVVGLVDRAPMVDEGGGRKSAARRGRGSDRATGRGGAWSKGKNKKGKGRGRRGSRG
jgi:ribonuclease R